MRKYPEYHRLLPQIRTLAQNAGEAILSQYGQLRPDEIMAKHDNSPLTVADLDSHRIIASSLPDLLGETPQLSEEDSESKDWTQRRRWSRYWLVDPLDGTKEFIKQNGEFTVNIALIEYNRPVLGLVHIPVSDTSYMGCAGVGAWRQTGKEQPSPIHPAVRNQNQPIRIVGSRSHGKDELGHFSPAFGDYEFLAVGSSLKFCWLAEGRADVYLRLNPTSEWDTAAGQAVLEAAGGSVWDLDVQPLRYNTKRSLINPSFLACGDPGRDWRHYVVDSP